MMKDINHKEGIHRLVRKRHVERRKNFIEIGEREDVGGRDVGENFFDESPAASEFDARLGIDLRKRFLEDSVKIQIDFFQEGFFLNDFPVKESGFRCVEIEDVFCFRKF